MKLTSQKSTSEISQQFVCFECIGEPYLSYAILKRRTIGICSRCDARRQCLTTGELAELIHQALNEHFYLTPHEPTGLEYSAIGFGIIRDWERRGDPVASVISGIVDIDEDFAKEIRSLLEQKYEFCGFDPDYENPYGIEACYEERTPDGSRLFQSWEKTMDDVRFRRRFFNDDVRGKLDEMFGDLMALLESSSREFVVNLGPNDEGSQFWRARSAPTVEKLEEILATPEREMNPPVAQKAKTGRMNSAGVSVFYGATNREICIAEVRPPVGGYVVLGKFELLRAVRLLDLGQLSRSYVEGSYFDPEYEELKKRGAFFKMLVERMSRPVVPDDEASEYITTQLVAEYLIDNDREVYDGLLYPSTQSKSDGSNIVLFDHGCRVADNTSGQSQGFSVALERTSDEDFAFLGVEDTEREVIVVRREQDEKDRLIGGRFGFLVDVDTECGYSNGDGLRENESLEILGLDRESVEVVRVAQMEPSWEIVEIWGHLFENGGED